MGGGEWVWVTVVVIREDVIFTAFPDVSYKTFMCVKDIAIMIWSGRLLSWAH